jgi:ribonuclease HI
MYTDGSCRGNPGPGGWGVLLKCLGQERELWGGLPATTNNRMELMAAIEGLRALTRPCSVTVYTDSEYLRRGVTEWLPVWKRRGWRTADRRPVKNDDLWRQLEEVSKVHQIEWRWVKGHAGDMGNERADQLANRGVNDVLGIVPVDGKDQGRSN